MSLDQIILAHYPKAADCSAAGKHIGEPVTCYENEADDDRYYLMKFDRCGHCNMPCSPSDYVSSEEEQQLRERGIIK